MTIYYALLDGEGSSWGVTIPDLPGCHGGGASAFDAIEDASSAGREWVKNAISKKRKIPEPSSFQDIVKLLQENETLTIVNIHTDNEVPVKVNISIDSNLLDEIDKAAEARGMTRSGYVEFAVKRLFPHSVSI